MLETRPGSGSFVAADAPERLGGGEPAGHDAGPFDLLEARLALEPGIARARRPPRAAATPRSRRCSPRWTPPRPAATAPAWNDGDRRFHRRLAALTGNPVLLGLADQVAAMMDQPLWQRLRDDSIAVPGRAHVHAAEHR